ncbi:MAG: NAD(P)H-dependent oxidoreductase [Pseudomonadota bacterium]
MRVLLLYAHPVETSYAAALHERALAVLQAHGHDVDDCDLYTEGFDAVMSRQERLDYHDTAINHTPVAAHVERLLAAEALITLSPIWNFGVPAILKGYMDRVFLPGVTFRLQEGRIGPGALALKRLVCIHTYGAKRWVAWAAGDPPRRQLMRVVGGLLAPNAPKRYLGLYDMNNATPAHRAAFLARVEAEMAQF